MIPVYVPSKGRAGRSTTLSALSSEGFQAVTVCTTPSEESRYRESYASQGWTFIQQGRPGIQGARQAILETARERGEGFIWMLDDDITSVSQRVGSSYPKMAFKAALATIESDARAIQEKEADRRTIAMVGPQFRHRAWAGPDYEWDVHLRNFILINPWHVEYWDHVKEDLDVVLQYLAKGFNTLRFNSYAFDSPTMGTLAGGCSEDYAAGALDEATRALVEKWPGVVSMRLNPRTGYVENRVNWKRARE